MKRIQEIDNFSHIILLDQLKREIEYEFHLVCSKDALRELRKRLNAKTNLLRVLSSKINLICNKLMNIDSKSIYTYY